MVVPKAMEGYGKISAGEKVGIVTGFFASLPKLGVILAKSPFRGSKGGVTIPKHMFYAFMRTMQDHLSRSQLHFVLPSTEDVYLKMCSKHSMKPQSTVLSDGAKGHWIGPTTAKNVLLFLHGGGYEIAASEYHAEWCRRVQDGLKDRDFAVVMLEYFITPYASFPTQLKQATELLKVLLEKEGKKPENIFLGGDSAGGNLTLALLSHLNHGHPDVEPLKLSGPLAGVILISPWVNFDLETKSMKDNQQSDMLNPKHLKSASEAYVKDAPRDAWVIPTSAANTWWNGLPLLAKDIFVWGGGGEMLVDAIREIVGALQSTHKSVQYLEVPRLGHEELIFDCFFGKKKHDYHLAIESWIADKCT